MDKQQGVIYQKQEKGYFEKRKLRRYAGVWSLWAMGVGAVISGDFFGWNFGLKAGGFGGLLTATFIVALMYLGICFSIAELSAALPHTGGAYSFGRTAMGPWGGFITGLAENMEYVLTPAVIVVGIGGYTGAIFNELFHFNIPDPLWWLIAYVLFVGINLLGVELTFKFTVVITFLSLGILLIFWIGAIPLFSWEHALNIEPQEGHSRWLPYGFGGILTALPFAVWFYLAIEQLPLAAEESHEPAKDLPRGLFWGIITLIIASILTLFLNAGISPGAAQVGNSNEPLFLAFQTIFGSGFGSLALSFVAVSGLIASFHAIIYAYGRNIYSLSRAGYFPKWLSITHSKRNTPHIALIAGAILGYVAALVIEVFLPKEHPIGAALLNMAVFGAVIAYIMQMISYIKIRKISGIQKPYLSPLGYTGAVFAGVISILIFIVLFLNPDYRSAVYGCLIWFILGLLYFAMHSRKRIVFSPEEEFAVQASSEARGEQ